MSITSDKFAKGLRYYRKKRGLTALALSRALEISHATISRWEASGPLPDGDTMDKICAILGIQIEELFSSEKTKVVDSKPKQLVLEDALEIVKKHWQHLQLKTKPRN